MSAVRRAGLASFLLPLLSFLAVAQPPKAIPSAARLADPDEVRRGLSLLPDYRGVRADGVKVAVLDYGFDGAGGERPYLPADAVVVEHYDADFVRRFGLGDPDFKKPFTPMNNHGRLMAQIVWAVTGSSPNGPKFYLLNAGGPTLFRRAVRYAIEQHVDIILFSGHFEGTGNYDGGGPINRAVDEAVAAGIIWVNAAGNDGGHVYNGPVREAVDGWLLLASGRDPTALHLRNRLDENAVTVTLTWNDYRDEEDAGTAKDLDMYVEDAVGRAVGNSTLRQVTGDRKAGPGETRNPRERVVLADLPAADRDYRIRVKRHAGRFGPADWLRILVTSARDVPVPVGKAGRVADAVQLLDASGRGEIYPPADNRGVITVGTAAAGCSVGPTADGRSKPDVYLEDPRARFTNGEEVGGTSVAAAYFAGAVAVMKASQPRLQASHILTLARRPVVRAASAAVAMPPVARDPEPLPLSPNEARALRQAEASLRSRLERGLPPGGVYVTVPLPRGRTTTLPVEDALRLWDKGGPGAPTPAPTDRGKSPADAQRQVPIWKTPGPRLLSEVAS
ncbi:MAG: S8 family serine peptidase [Gemmataceae bacterium]